MNTLADIQKIISSFFDIDSAKITINTKADDIADWDSFSHMELMTRIEAHFNTTIPLTVLMDFQNVGDIKTYIDNLDS